MKTEEIDCSTERLICTGLIVSERFTKEILSTLSLKYFTTAFTRIAASWCLYFWSKYEKVPGKNIVELFEQKSRHIQNSDTVELIQQFLESLSKEYEKSDGFNVQFALDRAGEYFRQRKIELSQEKITQALQSGHIEAAEKEILDFNIAVEKKTLAINKPFDLEEFKTALKDMGENFITNWPLGAEFLSLSAGALTFLASPTGHGKTTFLINLFLDVLQNYKNKRHYFLSYEENFAAIILKMISCFYGKKLSHDNYKTLQAYFQEESTQYFNQDADLKQFKEGVQSFIQLMKGGRVSYSDLGIEKIKLALQELCKKHENHIGVIFIDYLQQIPIEDSSARATWEKIKALCDALRDLAVKNNLAIVLPTQFNRTVVNPDAMILQNLSEGSDVEKSGNKIIALWNLDKPARYSNTEKGIHRNLFDKQGESIYPGNILVKVLKNRDGRAGISEIFPANFNIKKIYTEPVGEILTQEKKKGKDRL
jgi:hypothetical protein